MAKNIFNSNVRAGDKLWIEYNINPGQDQCGDYGYLKAYAQMREEAVINRKHFIKGVLKEITWHFNKPQFLIVISNSDYSVGITDPERLFLTL